MTELDKIDKRNENLKDDGELEDGIGERINRKAEEYARIDPNSKADNERKKTLRFEISRLELDLISKNKNGMAFFPLMAIKHRGQIEYNVFHEVFDDLLMEAFRLYNPDKGATFTTFIKDRLTFRIDTKLKNIKKQLENDQKLVDKLLEEITDENINVSQPDDKSKNNRKKKNKLKVVEKVKNFGYIDEGNNAEESDVTAELKLFCRLAILIEEHKKIEVHLNKKPKHFEGFFTFDTCKLIEDGWFVIEQVIKKDDLLFPVMELVMLRYLKDGEFESMLDVIENELQSEEILNNRGGAMENCYKLTENRVKYLNKQYKNLENALPSRRVSS
ncbi:MAG: hypothetical protein CVU99_10605 [Firmicutes bacterium HGW-Firmicutes-4]|jgi:hypothetical protein|nr:MAG: hypothetical protein CVU99_10605 [Firmicutes bacterium HGW-Firmicutes-4]